MSLDSASTTDQLGPLIGDDFNLDFVLPIISLIVIMTDSFRILCGIG